MRLASLATLACVALAACASAEKPEPKAAMSAAALTSAETADTAKSDAETKTKTAAEDWAEKKVHDAHDAVKAPAPREGGDPLAMNSEIEESSIPNIETTPASQLRPKSLGELNAALSVVPSASSIEEAAKKLGQRLGKPSWVESPKGSESAKRRIWVAPAGAKCHRLVLEPDGSVEVETASNDEWRMLAASARQNPCSGEIKRGISR